MVTRTTQGITVSVAVFYQTRQSRPALSQYVFAYQVTIENGTPHTLQLLRRQWHIWQSDGVVRQVSGDGVIGQQPVLAPGQSYQYVSACQLQTEFGKMWGNYTLQTVLDRQAIVADIPVFQMVVPYKLN